mgnify:CR=1 FL=1
MPTMLIQLPYTPEGGELAQLIHQGVTQAMPDATIQVAMDDAGGGGGEAGPLGPGGPPTGPPMAGGPPMGGPPQPAGPAPGIRRKTLPSNA